MHVQLRNPQYIYSSAVTAFAITIILGNATCRDTSCIGLISSRFSTPRLWNQGCCLLLFTDYLQSQYISITFDHDIAPDASSTVDCQSSHTTYLFLFCACRSKDVFFGYPEQRSRLNRVSSVTCFSYHNQGRLARKNSRLNYNKYQKQPFGISSS